MSKTSCLARQKIANNKGAWSPGSMAPDPGCRDCEQGKAIRKDLGLRTEGKVKGEKMEETAKRLIKPKNISTSEQIAITEQSEPDILTIDFTKHTDVLSKIRKVAEEELRTPEAQALWFLRSCLKVSANSLSTKLPFSA